MPIRVLIADPDESLLASYHEFLSRRGFEVITARNGLECIARLREFVPDVLVLEPELAWDQGPGSLVRLHESANLPPVPVLVLTSEKGPSSLEWLAAFSITDYHFKPLPPAQLANHIGALLRNYSPRRASGHGLSQSSSE
jgi:chemosensory pili system protein ChpA (sensor histidine kinase/response regulator)